MQGVDIFAYNTTGGADGGRSALDAGRRAIAIHAIEAWERARPADPTPPLGTGAVERVARAIAPYVTEDAHHEEARRVLREVRAMLTSEAAITAGHEATGIDRDTFAEAVGFVIDAALGPAEDATPVEPPAPAVGEVTDDVRELAIVLFQARRTNFGPVVVTDVVRSEYAMGTVDHAKYERMARAVAAWVRSTPAAPPPVLPWKAYAKEAFRENKRLARVVKLRDEQAREAARLSERTPASPHLGAVTDAEVEAALHAYDAQVTSRPHHYLEQANALPMRRALESLLASRRGAPSPAPIAVDREALGELWSEGDDRVRAKNSRGSTEEWLAAQQDEGVRLFTLGAEAAFAAVADRLADTCIPAAAPGIIAEARKALRLPAQEAWMAAMKDGEPEGVDAAVRYHRALRVKQVAEANEAAAGWRARAEKAEADLAAVLAALPVGGVGSAATQVAKLAADLTVQRWARDEAHDRLTALGVGERAENVAPRIDALVDRLKRQREADLAAATKRADDLARSNAEVRAERDAATKRAEDAESLLGGQREQLLGLCDIEARAISETKRLTAEILTLKSALRARPVVVPEAVRDILLAGLAQWRDGSDLIAAGQEAAAAIDRALAALASAPEAAGERVEACPVDAMSLAEWAKGEIETQPFEDIGGFTHEVLDTHEAVLLARQVAWLTAAVAKLGGRS